MVMPISFLLQQQDQEEVPDPEAEDSHRDDIHAPEVEMERSPQADISPPSPPPHATAAADSCHGRVSGINKICFLCSSYGRSQATVA